MDLEAVGVVEAYRLVRLHSFNASLNLLYALKAGLRDVRWTALPSEVKSKLQTAARTLKRRQ